MGHLIRQYLVQLGFSQIVEAEDGQIALEKLGNEKVDFIISDWPMPNLGGLQLKRSPENGGNEGDSLFDRSLIG